VIFAADAGVRERDRFAHLPAVEVGVAHAINKAGEVIEQVEQAAAGGAPAAAAAADTPSAAPAGGPVKLVAVTSCPTGIAHTYMAAEALEKAAKQRGYEIQVETQGSAGSTKLPDAAIAEATAVIFAADAGVRERERFSHLPAVEVGVAHAINKAGELVDQAAEAAAERSRGATTTAGAAPPAGARPARPAAAAAPAASSKGATVRQWLMTGVSYMLPFVTAGGILIALAFLFGDTITVVEENVYENLTFPALLFEIGSTAFSMLAPILAGFIAYAMADRPGIAPGIVGGLIAGEIGAGFLGALIAGLLAGATILALRKIPFPVGLRGLLPVLFLPLVGTFIVGTLMIVVVGEPIAAVASALTRFLEGLGGANAIFLGIILGLMMAFDMGGPVNKVAYAFGVAGIAAGVTGPMAAVMAAGMTPPLAIALATLVRPHLWTPAERQGGKAAWIMGLSFITEGAIPFAAADPIRVIPSLMLGSAITGGLSMAFGNTLPAPHGGLFVVALVNRWPLYLLAIAIGTVASAIAVVALKTFTGGSDEELAAPEEFTTQEVARA
jgi:PTS system fructose-specific IIC component